jgi:hypothetical protein
MLFRILMCLVFFKVSILMPKEPQQPSRLLQNVDLGFSVFVF